MSSTSACRSSTNRASNDSFPPCMSFPASLAPRKRIGELDIAESSQEMRDLRDGARQLGMLRRATWWLMFEPGETNDLAATLFTNTSTCCSCSTSTRSSSRSNRLRVSQAGHAKNVRGDRLSRHGSVCREVANGTASLDVAGVHRAAKVAEHRIALSPAARAAGRELAVMFRMPDVLDHRLEHVGKDDVRSHARRERGARADTAYRLRRVVARADAPRSNVDRTDR